jgi:O-acetyl-ADP-ribose deacetylase (regulator of RNase III)
MYPSGIAEHQAEDTYKATILAAIAHGKETVYLTEVGGGVFGNSQESITEAIADAVSYAKEQNFGRALEVKVVSWIGDVEDWYGKHGGKYGSAVREPRAQALKAIRLEGFADAM